MDLIADQYDWGDRTRDLEVVSNNYGWTTGGWGCCCTSAATAPGASPQ